MPVYKVLENGFHEGSLYSPGGKRNMVVTDEPFPIDKKTKKEMVPSWLQRVNASVDKVKSKQSAQRKKDLADAEDAKQQLESASFMAADDSKVETL